MGALGDVLMTTPVIRQLRHAYPKAKIDYLVGKSYRQILVSNKYVDEVLTFDENIILRKNFFGLFKLSNQVKKRKYDVVFAFDKHWIFGLLSKMFSIKRRIGFDRLGKEGLFYTDKVNYGPVRHEIYYYLDLLNLFIKANYNDTQIDFFLNNRSIESAKKLLKAKNISDFVVCANSGGENPGEKGGIRKLPDSAYLKLLDALSKKNKVVLVGSGKDIEYCNKFSDDKRVFNFAGLSIDESIAVMKFAKRIYTTDCGTMHMASAVNDNITCFFGPTNPKRKAPLVKGIKVFWNDSDIYEEKYELFGKVPKEKVFFKKFDIKKLS